MRDAIVQANGDIVRHSKAFPDTDGMGSTLVMAWVNGQELHLSWVGDSRCYLWRGGKLTQLSKDHSYVQTLVDEGKLTTEQAFFHPESNVITQSLGDSGRDPKPDYLTLPLSDNDVLLLCSDGLNSMLQDNKIGEVITGAGDLLSGAEQLIEEANAAGGSDNITVILAKVVGGALSRAGDERPVTAVKKKNSSKKLVYGLLILAALATASFFGAPALMSKIRQHNGEDPIKKRAAIRHKKERSFRRPTGPPRARAGPRAAMWWTARGKQRRTTRSRRLRRRPVKNPR
jgi:serine/threonine protein phosphatase PrpC